MLQPASASFEICHEILGASLPSFDISFPDLTILDKISNLINKAAEALVDQVETLKRDLGYHICCNDLVAWFADIFTVAVAMFDAVFCAVDGAAGVAIDQLLAQFDGLVAYFLEPFLEGVNLLAGALNGRTITVPSIEIPFSDVDLTSCKLGLTTNIADFITEQQWDLFVDNPFFEVGGGGQNDLSDIADAVLDGIIESCNEAKENIENQLNAIGDDGDCCGIMHTCSLNDQLILYSNVNCDGDIVGTIPGTVDGVYEFRASGTDCLANDEASSMQLAGPLPKGTRIHVGDNPTYLCEDDYAQILLT